MTIDAGAGDVEGIKLATMKGVDVPGILTARRVLSIPLPLAGITRARSRCHWTTAGQRRDDSGWVGLPQGLSPQPAGR